MAFPCCCCRNLHVRASSHSIGKMHSCEVCLSLSLCCAVQTCAVPIIAATGCASEMVAPAATYMQIRAFSMPATLVLMMAQVCSSTLMLLAAACDPPLSSHAFGHPLTALLGRAKHLSRIDQPVCFSCIHHQPEQHRIALEHRIQHDW